MYIKRFRRGFEAVPDPMRPARTVQRPVLVPVEVTSFVYTDPATGKRVELEPDEDGGFEVPETVGQEHIRFRTPEGGGWYPEYALVEQRRLGRVDDAPARRRASDGEGSEGKGARRRPAPEGDEK